MVNTQIKYDTPVANVASILDNEQTIQSLKFSTKMRKKVDKNRRKGC